MSDIWSEHNKFSKWLDVELTMIQVREDMGLFPDGVSSQIMEMATFTVEGIEEREKVNEHDLLAFVEDVRASLPPEMRQYVHGLDMTSYDTEVPAMAMITSDAIDVIMSALEALIVAFRLQATRHARTYCMGITHGRDGEPTTFGWRLCSYIEMLKNRLASLEAIQTKIKEVKCSGAMGNYMTICPQEEEDLCCLLGLKVRPAATQIVARDVFTQFLSELAVLGGCIEKIATDFRLLATSAYGEIEEPRKKGQKGSSAMPHKKNPILLERMCGFAIMLRGYAAMGQELIRTWLERDIAHSSVERVALADACHVVHYMLQKMTIIVTNLVVNRERMTENIQREFGCWASGRVKSLLEKKGLDPEQVYRFIQACAFLAFQSKIDFLTVLWEAKFGPDGDLLTGEPISKWVSREELETCFDFVAQLHNLEIAYDRMNIPLTSAEVLEPNFGTNHNKK